MTPFSETATKSPFPNATDLHVFASGTNRGLQLRSDPEQFVTVVVFSGTFGIGVLDDSRRILDNSSVFLSNAGILQLIAVSNIKNRIQKCEVFEIIIFENFISTFIVCFYTLENSLLLGNL
ncbi:MAG: hypothetical protein O9346_06550 [Leptospiraceae bacterium]|nr:hypothetical protein [Leptospiraceae bacterium]